jgi:hypothetical protein
MAPDQPGKDGLLSLLTTATGLLLTVPVLTRHNPLGGQDAHETAHEGDQ